MPRKDREARLAYQREWYAKNSKRVVKKVAARKWGAYGGRCQYCGAPTMGETKGAAPVFCGKPECRSAHYKKHPEQFVEAGRRGWERTQLSTRHKLLNASVVSIDDLSQTF